MSGLLDPAYNSISSFTALVVGHPVPLADAVTIMLPLLYNVVELSAFVLLFRAVRRGLAQNISLQTLLALAVGPTFAALLDVGYWYVYRCKIVRDVQLPLGWWLLVLSPAIVAAATWACVWKVRRYCHASNEDEDHLLDLERWPRWMSWCAVYVCAVLATFVITLFVCQITPNGIQELKHFEIVATFMNFLHGFALLPQLVLSRRKGFIAPVAVKFLLLLGTKCIMEFVIDIRTSIFASNGTANTKDIGCLLGDFVAAIVLIDFLYLWSITFYKRGMRNGIKPFDI